VPTAQSDKCDIVVFHLHLSRALYLPPQPYQHFSSSCLTSKMEGNTNIYYIYIYIYIYIYNLDNN